MLKPHKYQVIQDYQSPYPDPIIFRKGEQVTVDRNFKGDPDWPNWCWCKGKNKNADWFPSSISQLKGRNVTLSRITMPRN
jgi:hypothetical protein